MAMNRGRMAKAGEKTIEAEKGGSSSVTAEPVVASQVSNGLRRTLGAAPSRTGTQGAIMTPLSHRRQ